LTGPDDQIRPGPHRGRARVRSWLHWTTKEKVEAVGLVALAAAAEIAVRVVSLPALTRRLGITLENGGSEPVPATAGTRGSGLDPPTIERRAEAVDRLYRAWPRRNSCLRRAVVLGFYVRRARPVLRIGVAHDGDEVRAHAWIEVDGRVLGDDSGDYAPLRPPARHTG
jgi:hypothetical protein